MVPSLPPISPEPRMPIRIAAPSSLPFGFAVLFVADPFHPVGRLAAELFLNGDVRHGRGCRSAVPVLLTRWEPDHVARPNCLDRTSPALCEAAARRHDQVLTQRVGVPCGAGAGLEGDT